MRIQIRLAAIPGALLAVALATRALLAVPPPAIAPDLAQPLAVVTNWHAFGAQLLGAFGLGLIAAMAGYLFVVRSAVAPKLLIALGVGALAMACAWCVPVLFSSDVYAYAAYGEIVRLGGNPYAHATLAHGNPILDSAVWQWGNPLPVCVYGPFFVALALATVVAFAPLHVAGQLEALRLGAALALPLCAALAYDAYPGDRQARLAAAATIALNPVLVWCAVEGHNETLVLLVVLAGFALVRRGAIVWGAFAIALSGAVKLSGLGAALAFAWHERRARIAVAAGAAIALALSVQLLVGVATQLAPAGRYAPQASLQGVVMAAGLLAFRSERIATAAAWATAVVVAAWLAARGLARLRGESHEAWGWFALAGWALVPNPYPWYALWLVAAAALAPRTRVGFCLLLFSLASLLRYVPDAVAPPPVALGLVLAIVASLPYAALAGWPRRA